MWESLQCSSPFPNSLRSIFFHAWLKDWGKIHFRAPCQLEVFRYNLWRFYFPTRGWEGLKKKKRKEKRPRNKQLVLINCDTLCNCLRGIEIDSTGRLIAMITIYIFVILSLLITWKWIRQGVSIPVLPFFGFFAILTKARIKYSSHKCFTNIWNCWTTCNTDPQPKQLIRYSCSLSSILERCLPSSKI